VIGFLPVQVVTMIVAQYPANLSLLEAEMRTVIATLASLVVLAAVSVHAAPLPPANATSTELSSVPPIEQVAQGCGWGWHRHHWRDRWGYWHGGRCVANW
jgi:hypothetical protein